LYNHTNMHTLRTTRQKSAAISDSSVVIRALSSPVVAVVLALLPPLVELPPLLLDPPFRLESVAQLVGESLYFPMGHLAQMTSSPLKMVEVAAVHVRVADPADMW
jgi:hypothetical protein